MNCQSLAATLAALVISLPALAADKATDKVLATVDGHKITQSMLDTYAMQRGAPSPADVNPEQKERLVTELINREILFQKALAEKKDKDAQAQQELDSARRNILASFIIRGLTEGKNAVTDEVVKEEYNKYVATLSNKEYQARHILLTSEADAKAVIAELDKGGDFKKLAEDKTTDTSSKTSGGDLGWFRPEQMVKPFSDALAKLEKGQYTKAPVQTDFGWHVIKLDDTRPVDPPPFTAIKDQLAQKVRADRVTNYLEEMRKKAKIEMMK